MSLAKAQLNLSQRRKVRKGFINKFNREGAKGAKMSLAKVFKISRKGAKCAKIF